MAIAIGIFVQTDGGGVTRRIYRPRCHSQADRQQSVSQVRSRGQRDICLKFLLSRICCLSLRHCIQISLWAGYFTGSTIHLKIDRAAKSSFEVHDAYLH